MNKKKGLKNRATFSSVFVLISVSFKISSGFYFFKNEEL